MKRKLWLCIFLGTLIFCSGCAKREETPVSVYPQETIAVSFQEGTLHGTLMYPVDKESETVILLVPGSGPTDRNGNNPEAPGNNHLLLLAEGLAEKGFATLRYDKRGIGESKNLVKKESDLTFDLGVSDVRALAEEALKKGFSRMILLGHSEGALIAEAAAGGNNHFDAVILVSGSAVPADQLIMNQLSAADPEIASLAKPIVESLKAGEIVPKVPVSLFSLFRPTVQPYLISWFALDPVDLIKKIEVPVLVIHGDRDLQVPVEDAEVLFQGANKGSKAIIEGMNHILKEAPLDRKGNLATYTQANLPIHPGFLDKIIEFLEKL